MTRYEVVNIITYWKRTAQSNEKVGWILRDTENQTDCGYTFDEAWELIHQFGAINVAEKLRKTNSREIKELEPFPPQPGFLDTSWQIKYENTKDLTYSPSCLEHILNLVQNDEKKRLTSRRDQWLRTQKELISTWRTYQNIMSCIEIAQQVQKAKNLVIYVGASVWQETGLADIYASDAIADPEHPEDLFFQSIQTELANLNIGSGRDPFNYVDLPYVFDFIRVVKSLNSNMMVLFETEKGIFQKRRVDSSPQLVIAIGAEVPNEISQVDQAFYIGHEPYKNSSRYKIALHAPITQVLKEVERHFIMKGRIICDVCGEKVAPGVAGSSIAPTSVAICFSCGSKGAEPYWVLTTKVADLMCHLHDYKLSPRLSFVKRATLSITGISEEKFWEDVGEKRMEIMKRRKQ